MRRIAFLVFRLARFGLFGALVGLAACASPPPAPAGTPPTDAARPSASSTPMTLERLSGLLGARGAEVKGEQGFWELTHLGVRMVCMADAEHDRMRIVAPIIRTTDLDAENVHSILEANFHSALDGRYATSHGVLYAAFIHPLAALSEAELHSALEQVAHLANTFGSTYTSGLLQFGDP